MKKLTITYIVILLSVCVVNAQADKSSGVNSDKIKNAAEKTQTTANKVNGTNSTQATNAVTYDFTTGSNKYYGGAAAAVEVEPGVWAMIAGDGNQDGQITTLDYDAWLPNAKAAVIGYSNTDLNMDAQNTTLDYDLWLPNAKAAKTSQVPN